MFSPNRERLFHNFGPRPDKYVENSLKKVEISGILEQEFVNIERITICQSELINHTSANAKSNMVS